MSDGQSVSPEISCTWDDFGEPEALPRIGDEYQAIIPPLVVKSDDFGLLKIQAGGLHDIYVGFPAPVAYVYDVEILKQKQHNSSDNLVMASNQSKHPTVTENQDVSEAQEVKSCDDMTNKDSKRATTSCNSTSFLFQQEMKMEMKESNVGNGQNVVKMLVCRGFIEGKVRLEEYVFSLKASVGLNAFVEAVGIGKGKQDLTSTAMDPVKSNHAHPARPEIPIGKACSTLTPVEIVKFLTGDFRLSKARSSDLFWEAVWPRLLAKGWHSEQANNYGTVGLKHGLVFLIPGVKNFCRRKQVKGEHYYDAISDVLSKVASNPALLDLDIVDKNCSDKEESESSGQQRYCYLKPRTPVHSTNTMKFMVVDTSLADGSTFKVRELRSLPIEIINTYVSKSQSEDDEQISSEISMDDTHSDNTMHFNKEVSDISKGTRISLDEKVHIDEETCVGNSSNKVSSNDSQQREAVLHQMSQGKPNSASWELNTCGQQVSCNLIKIFTDPELKEEHSSSDHYDLSRNILLQVDNLPLSSLSKRSTVISYVDDPTVVEAPRSRHVPRTLIDLNLPIPQDSDSHGSSTMEVKGQKTRPNKCSESLDISERDSSMISRRQSNRNRPPTTRALEAHALGLLDVKQKRKSKDVFLEENYMLGTSSQHAHAAKVRHLDKFGNGIVDFKLEDRESSVCNDNTNMFHKLEV
ncbi:hypothetical protein SDJN02_20491, partial [Cucurbita argyrosperma subsp. argyrosperma]